MQFQNLHKKLSTLQLAEKANSTSAGNGELGTDVVCIHTEAKAPIS
eukprot:CAMPEP_0180154036 /NCGR_PEP_ID=MMETSP0986-20121125/23920_1 /TAXON_ID=697907 /ORGANISM="non described non described, Strain CCMP2293" /LENGTH=45 /DNA_ID= /DNA_START= /DNA_END= /DNA_ORIENTATION=